MSLDSSQPDFRLLYERYGMSVYKRCYYFLRDTSDAEDAMHEVFIRVMERYQDFRGAASPLTWMVRITTNHCLNILRSRKARWKKRYEQNEIVDKEKRANHDFLSMERKDLVHAILLDMKAELQEAAIYYFVDGMTQEDASGYVLSYKQPAKL